MFNPCIDHCYIRYGKEYTEECDENCDYAKVAKELKNKEVNKEQILKEIKAHLIKAAKHQLDKRGKVFILTENELNKLIMLIKKI